MKNKSNKITKLTLKITIILFVVFGIGIDPMNGELPNKVLAETGTTSYITNPDFSKVGVGPIDVLLEGEIAATIIVHNDSAITMPVTLMLALYNNNKLIDIKSVKREVTQTSLDQPEYISTSILVPELTYGNYHLTAFVWNNYQQLKPLISKAELKPGSITNTLNAKGIYNVIADYGAKGNGIEDDYFRINRAVLHAQVVGGGVINFPSGEYRINTNLTIPENITLKFDYGACISPAAQKNIIINGCIDAGLQQIFAGNGTVTGNMQVSEIFPQWWGAKGDGTHDDKAAIQAAIDVAQSKGYSKVRLNSGNYVISDSLNLDGTKGSVDIVGTNMQSVRLTYDTFSSKKPAIKYIGQEGVQLKGITFEGSPTGVAVECNSSKWIIISECAFKTNAVGVLMSNDTMGGVTENIVVENSRFDYSCINALEYNKGIGTEFFRGSGLKECLVNLPAGSDNHMVNIGGGCFVYNSPMSVQCWSKSDPNQILIFNNFDSVPWFYGNITTENQCTIGGGNNTPIYLAGEVLSLGAVQLGTCNAENKLVKYGPEGGSYNGATTTWREPFVQSYNLMTGANTTINVSGQKSALIYVTISGTNYDYRYLLSVTHNGYGNQGDVNKVSVIKEPDSALAPTFTLDSGGNLIITGSSFPVSGYNADLFVTPMAVSMPFDMW